MGKVRLLCAVGLLLLAGTPGCVWGAELAEHVRIGGRVLQGEPTRGPPGEPLLDAQGEGLEQPISYPDDAGDTLLKQALGGEDAVNSMGQDDDFEEKYQPTYEYGEQEGAEGQDESDGLEAVMQSEKAYFVARDHDGDGELSKAEFIRQLHAIDVDEDVADAWDSWNVSERGRPAPSQDELMWGKDWTARLSDQQAEEAFNEYDMDKDGKVSWAEWQGLMFHEDNQTPEYRDGLEAVVDSVNDDDIDPAELEEIKARFVQGDTNKDGSLSTEELYALIGTSCTPRMLVVAACLSA